MDKNPLLVTLYGLNERSYKTMVLFLAGPCKGKAKVVESADAEIDILDADFPTAKYILDQCRESNPDRPIIVMSLENLRLEETIFLKKPVNATAMIAALKQVRKLLEVKQKNSADIELPGQEVVGNLVEDSKSTDQTNVAYRQVGRRYTEGGFSAFLGIIPDINFNDRAQVIRASYNPKNHFQGYVQSAFSVANAKDRVVKLNSSWKPLYILPKSQEVSLEVSDSQLRVFAEG